jgi:AsmA protein
MAKSLKIFLLAVGGIVGLLVLIALAVLLFVDADDYKPRVETAASAALGMEVKVDGRLGIGFFPGLHATLRDVHIRNRGTEVVSAKEASLEIALLPLLHREIRIVRIGFKHPTISIERDRDGHLNFENPNDAKGTPPVLEPVKFFVSDATIRYTNKPSGEIVEAGSCNIDVRNLQLSDGKSQDLLKHVALTSQLACAQVRGEKFLVSNLKISIAGKDGIFDLDPVTMEVFGGQGSARINADFSGAISHYRIAYTLPQFRIEEFLKILSPKKVADGSMDFSAKLTMQGNSIDDMKRTAEGVTSLRGTDLTVYGHDLDRELSRYESSQNFNLVDVGAFFFAGPIGVAVTKGYSFVSILEGPGGISTIRTLVSDWEVERGVAKAQDVAMATNENRIALKGNLDFVNERFDNVTMAFIDASGCARVAQVITGPFLKPAVEKPNVLASLAGPVLELLKKGTEILPGGGQCEVFYDGSVAAPK